jgi:hypothetical protein
VAAAAARKDFLAAAHLQCTLDVLGPKPTPHPLAAFTSSDPDEVRKTPSRPRSWANFSRL